MRSAKLLFLFLNWLSASLLFSCATGTSFISDSNNNSDGSIPDNQIIDDVTFNDFADDSSMGKDLLPIELGLDLSTIPDQDSVIPIDQSLSPDQSFLVDQTVDFPIGAPNIGALCTTNVDCVNGAQCLLSVDTGLSLCTMLCTQDNYSTTANEDTCPDLTKNICGKVKLSDGSTQNFCLPRCIPKDNSNDCPSHLACHPQTASLSGLADVAVCFVPACKSSLDCPVLTSKQCSAGCTGNEFCETTTSLCALPGNCQSNGLCGPNNYGSATAKVGDPCKGDIDCGSAMRCLRQSTDSNGNVTNRNGYCTIIGCHFTTLTNAACPSGSTCSHLYVGGLCRRTCSLFDPTSCRNHTGDYLGDYECYAWDNFAINGQQVTTLPVCESPIPCSAMGSYGCSGLGEIFNVTDMKCRNLKTNLDTLSADPNGRCLDDTASGPLAP